MIKAILFDIDGVLLDSRKANHKFYQDILVDAGYEKPARQETSKIYNLTLYDGIKYLTKEQSDEKVKIIWQPAIDSYKVKYQSKFLKFPRDMVDTIKQLSKRYKLAIATGRLKRGVETFYKVSGLKECFKAVSCFEDYSKPKPDPEPLMIALERLHIISKEAIYVGDSQSDLLAAKAIEMKFITFYGISGKIFEEADANIKSFKDLPKEILRL